MEGVFVRGGLAEVREDFLEVYGTEDFDKVVHNPSDAVVEVYGGESRRTSFAKKGFDLGTSEAAS